jgi:hypothetical protein
LDPEQCGEGADCGRDVERDPSTIFKIDPAVF